MAKVLIVDPGDYSVAQIFDKLPQNWISEYDEIGFSGKRSETLHDVIDDHLIANNQEESLITLMFPKTSDLLEYVGDLLRTGEEIQKLTLNSYSSEPITVEAISETNWS